MERFNLVSDDHGRKRKYDFSVSDRKYPLWANLVQNIKIVNLNWNLEPNQFEHAEVSGDIHFLFFR